MNATKNIFLTVLVGFALVLSAGCDDDPKPAKRPQRPGGGGGGKAKRKKGPTGPQLKTYPRVAEELRHKFVDEDFRPDITGEENRDPFRDYVTSSPLLAVANQGDAKREDKCKPDRWKASNYARRDLKLTGIILQGTRAFVHFRDRKGVGHTVMRGDCVGKEKAVVTSVGSGFVRLEIQPEAPSTGAEPPAPQTIDLALNPNELNLEEEGDATGIN